MSHHLTRTVARLPGVRHQSASTCSAARCRTSILDKGMALVAGEDKPRKCWAPQNACVQSCFLKNDRGQTEMAKKMDLVKHVPVVDAE